MLYTPFLVNGNRTSALSLDQGKSPCAQKVRWFRPLPPLPAIARPFPNKAASLCPNTHKVQGDANRHLRGKQCGTDTPKCCQGKVFPRNKIALAPIHSCTSCLSDPTSVSALCLSCANTPGTHPETQTTPDPQTRQADGQVIQALG